MTIKIYKLTDQNSQTRGSTQWGDCVKHTAPGKGPLCGPGWIHAYEHPLLAVLLNPIHANFHNPQLWEAAGEGELLRDGQLKLGVAELTTVQQIPLPVVTTEQRVEFGIRCALEVCNCAEWRNWVEKWLTGEDRTKLSAAEAARAEAATWTAAARAATWAAEAAASRAGNPLDLIAIAVRVCT